jgi:hypothetical protein
LRRGPLLPAAWRKVAAIVADPSGAEDPAWEKLAQNPEKLPVVREVARKSIRKIENLVKVFLNEKMISQTAKPVDDTLSN